MTKNKQSRRPTPPRRLVESTYEAFALSEKGKSAEALTILLELDRNYPNTPEVLGGLVNAYYDLQNHGEYEHAIRQLIRLEPQSPDLNFGLAGAYLVNGRPALALRTFQDAIRRWPSNPKSAEAQKQIPLLERAIREQTSGLNLSEDQAFSLLIQHDELRYCLAHAEYRQARLVAEKLLHSFPDFIPALNNLAQIFAIDGNFDQAIQICLRVLKVEPENIHALSNLTRLYFLGRHPAEAADYAKRLKSSQSDSTGRWTKIAEALTFMEDDDGVLALYDQAKAAGGLEPPETDEIFFHLLAAAAYYQGKEKEARNYWQKALKINPNFDWARNNLADLNKEAIERSGVWAYPMESWLLATVVQGLTNQLERLKQAAKKADVQATLSKLFTEKYPHVFFLAPHMVARGDAKAGEFVVRMAAVTGHPDLVDAAKTYVFGKRGPHRERFQAAQILSEAELLPSGSIRMWNGEEMREVMLLNIEISPEANPGKLPRRVLTLAEQAFDSLRAKDGPRAEALLEQAIALAPDDPSLVNNLAMALEMQGKSDLARRMILDLHERFPDYFFGIIAVGILELERGNLDRAHELVNGLIQRKKMHTSEFTALCRAQIQIGLAEKNYEVARMWIEVWEKVDPDNPDAASYRRRIGPQRKR